MMRLRAALALSSTVIAAGIAVLAAAPSAAPRDEWRHLAGWYRLGDGREVLLTWAAEGDLRLAAQSEQLPPNGPMLVHDLPLLHGLDEDKRLAAALPAYWPLASNP